MQDQRSLSFSERYKETIKTPNGITSISKVKKYKWVKDIGHPGILEFVPKTQLEIDPSYQRAENMSKATAIAANFNWRMFGTIVASLRDDKKLYITDGQHRAMGAMLRDDITLVPCFIFEDMTNVDEATSFLGCNTLRKPISAIDKFNALLITNNPEAVLIQKLATQAGRTITNIGGSPNASGGKIRCVTLLLKYAHQDPSSLVAMWPLINSVCVGVPLHEKVIDGLMYLHKNADQPIVSGIWAQRLIKYGALRLLEGIQASSAFYARGSAQVFARGILRVVNHKVRNPLSLKGEEVI